MRRLTTAAAVTLVLAACGSPSSTQRDAADVVALAAETMRDAGSMSFTMDMAMSGEGFSMEMDAEGAMDMENRLGQITMQMPGFFGFGGADTSIEMRLIDDVMYMKIPDVGGTAGLPQGKTWMRVDLNDVGGGLAAGDPFSSSDPTAYADFLRGVSGDVETVGQEDIRGHATTHYRAEVDLGKALEQLPKEQQDLAGEQLEAFKDQFGVGSMPIDVWIDNDGLIWRESFVMELGESGRMTMSFDVLEYGVPVEVEEPPAGEVIDAPGLGTGLPGGTMSP